MLSALNWWGFDAMILAALDSSAASSFSKAVGVMTTSFELIIELRLAYEGIDIAGAALLSLSAKALQV